MTLLSLCRALFWPLLGSVLVVALLPADEAPALFESDKVGHLVAFFGLSVVAGVLWPRSNVFPLFAALAAFGGMIEILQWAFGAGRDAEWMDLAADLAGTSLGLLAARSMGAMKERLSAAGETDPPSAAQSSAGAAGGTGTADRSRRAPPDL